MPDIEVPVLIVGGSLVGLSSALLLARQGIRSLTVEHHRGTAIHPRAAQMNPRTLEVLRSVGLEQVALEKSEKQFVQEGAVMAVETLAGEELAWYVPNINAGTREVSPCPRVFLTQNLLEPLLKVRAEELGAELRFGTDMVSFEQDAEGVSAVIRDRDSGTAATVRARYLIGADGSHSRVRDSLQIRMLGRGVLSRSVTIYFRGNVGPLLRGRNLSVIYVYNSELTGFFRIEKPFDSGFLAVNSIGPPDQPNTDVWSSLSDGNCRRWLRASLGADVPLAIENVMEWEATADTAERFADGRIFLAGDAAHCMPPTGGFGGNTGVEDARNLAWKLALVLKGLAPPALLATYESERRPVGVFTVEQAYARYVTRWAPYLGTQDIAPIANDLDIDLGYRYRSPAVIADGGDDGRLLEATKETKGRPGTRAPHLWVEKSGSSMSTLDLFGPGFTLLAGPRGAAWCAIASTAASQVGVALEAHIVGADGFPDAYGITPSGAVLVRPDGVIGWRASGDEGASAATISRILSTLLCQ
jgi:2-polyprenyl-6-methoxyphenol hydroxylase-like FAD-dependent oxidoreductase